MTIGCGNVGISRSVRDFQVPVETVLVVSIGTSFPQPSSLWPCTRPPREAALPVPGASVVPGASYALVCERPSQQIAHGRRLGSSGPAARPRRGGRVPTQAAPVVTGPRDNAARRTQESPRDARAHLSRSGRHLIAKVGETSATGIAPRPPQLAGLLHTRPPSRAEPHVRWILMKVRKVLIATPHVVLDLAAIRSARPGPSGVGRRTLAKELRTKVLARFMRIV